MLKYHEIIEKLPYQEPFLFVDELLSVSKDGISGTYTFKKEHYFYKGHFKNNPVTPGVILTECMAQISLACFGIFLLENENISEIPTFALSKTDIDFYLPVFPGEKVKVISEKIYFRFGKLKCKTEMRNFNSELIAKGTLSGMVVKEKR